MPSPYRTAKRAPFRVEKDRGIDQWVLYMRGALGELCWRGDFDTQGAAIDHAYRSWPWWP